MASSVQWTEHFGLSSAQPHTAFCLMARGFLPLPPTKNVQAVTDAWLRKKHPNAKLVGQNVLVWRQLPPKILRLNLLLYG